MRSLDRALVRAALCALALAACAAPAHAAWPVDGRALCTASGDQNYPVMAPDGTGGAIAVWEDRRGTASDVYAMRVGPNGVLGSGWPADGRALCTAAQDQVAPVIASDGVGGAYIAWEDYRAGGSNPDIYVQRVNAGGAIAAGWPASGVDVCTLTSVQGHPSIVRDGAGGAIVVWEDFRSGLGDIYAQRVNTAGIAQWTVSGIPICAAAGDQRFPVAVTDGAGGAIIVWEDDRNGAGNGDVFAQRVSISGVVQWATNGVPVTTAAGDQIELHAASDGAGGVLVEWEDHRSDNSDVYAQRIGADGAAKWTADGLAICTDLAEQYGGSIAADGAGGAFVAWIDLRAGLSDIYAQHATPAGAIAAGWPANGLAICTADGNQFDPAVASDAAGGAFIAWNDQRTGAAATDVYALRVSGAGTLPAGWSANGAVYCGAAGDQYLNSIMADGTGGAIIAWSDQRGTSADIYAQRIAGAGGVPTVDVPGLPALPPVALAAAPNPMRVATRLAFSLDAESRVDARITDVSGRTVRVLLDGVALAPGPHTLDWDGRDAAGARLPAGVYLAVVRAGAAPARVEKLALIP
ncbi:MAG: hypothetical protein HY076_02070 [Candidatus Eisenbacteria bacterium]|uniref:FlgD/Vpr Ig-like domain-containing protein n=1 Tax=Eiseniibacteriota bacterium TaxID=2212470 RepID=A0A9D6L9E0_UNCEI|nr:hypothetical protein [Candidatus Eisenbacteria bacterium]